MATIVCSEMKCQGLNFLAQRGSAFVVERIFVKFAVETDVGATDAGLAKVYTNRTIAKARTGIGAFDAFGVPGGVAEGAGGFEIDVVAGEACACVGSEDAFFGYFDKEVGFPRVLASGFLHLNVDAVEDPKTLQALGCPVGRCEEV